MGILFSSPPDHHHRSLSHEYTSNSPPFMKGARFIHKEIPKSETCEWLKIITEREMEMLEAGEEGITEVEMQELKKKLMEKKLEMTKEDVQELKKKLMEKMQELKVEKSQEMQIKKLLIDEEEMTEEEMQEFKKKLVEQKQALKKMFIGEFLVKKMQESNVFNLSP
ncbi:unnamed protein product [Urochloa humidicola]